MERGEELEQAIPARDILLVTNTTVGPLYAATTAAGAKFRTMVQTDGLAAALKARMDQFQD